MTWRPVRGCADVVGGAGLYVLQEASWYISDVCMVVDGELLDWSLGEGSFGEQGADGFG